MVLHHPVTLRMSTYVHNVSAWILLELWTIRCGVVT